MFIATDPGFDFRAPLEAECNYATPRGAKMMMTMAEEL